MRRKRKCALRVKIAPTQNAPTHISATSEHVERVETAYTNIQREIVDQGMKMVLANWEKNARIIYVNSDTCAYS